MLEALYVPHSGTLKSTYLAFTARKLLQQIQQTTRENSGSHGDDHDITAFWDVTLRSGTSVIPDYTTSQPTKQYLQNKVRTVCRIYSITKRNTMFKYFVPNVYIRIIFYVQRPMVSYVVNGNWMLTEVFILYMHVSVLGIEAEASAIPNRSPLNQVVQSSVRVGTHL
jgi:hypothetical protein